MNTFNTPLYTGRSWQALLQRLSGDYCQKTEQEIRGTSYVVDCLEAALWSFWTTDNFADAILKAANLGDDADTTAAVCGQIAGAYYGYSAIPRSWKKRLAQRQMLEQLADRLYAVGHECGESDFL